MNADPPRQGPAPGMVEIHYQRPPSRLQIFTQHLVFDSPEVVVTLARDMSLQQTIRIEGDIVLEDGSDVVWFTFPGLWHDIGRFHRADGTFSGIYANVLTPPRMNGRIWHTTDLYLDVWISPSGAALILDEHEFDDAVGRELIDAETARRAREEADALLKRAQAGTWPPAIVQEWTRERALAVVVSAG